MDPYGVNIHLTDGTSFYGQNHEIPTSYSNSLDILSLSKPDPYSNPYASVGLSQNTEDVFASKLNGLATSDWTSLPSSPARVTHTQFEAYKTPDLYAGSDLHFASKEVPVSIGSATSAENFASYAPAHNFEAKNITSIVGSDLKIDMHIPASISLQSEYRPEVDSLKAVDDILRRAVLTPTNQTLGLGKTFDFSSDSNEANKPRDTLESLLYPKTVGSVNVLGDILTPNIGSNLNLDLHSQVPAQLQSEYKPDLTNLYSTNALDGGSIRNSQDFHGVGLTPTHQSLTGFGPSFELGEALKVKDTLDSILNPKTTGSVNNILGDILGPKVGSNLNLDYHSQVPAQLQSDYKTDIDSIIPSSLATSSYKTAEEILKSEGLADKAFLGLDTSSNLSFETGSNKPKEDYGMLLSPKNLTSLNQITDTKGLNQSSNTDKYGFSREDIYGLKTSMTLFDTVLNSKVPAPKATDNILTSDAQGKNLKAEKIELQPILTKFSDDGQYAYSPLADSRSHSLNYLSGFGEALSPIAKGLNIRANNNEQIIGGNASFNFLDSYRDKSYKSVTDMILQEKVIGSVTDTLMKEKDINSILNEKVSLPVSEIVPAEKAISSQIDTLITSSAIDKLLYPNITNPSEIKSTLTVDQILASAPQTGISNVPEQPIHSAVDLLLQGASAKSTVDEFLSGRSAYSAIDLSFNDKALNSIVNPIPAQSTSTVEQLLNQKPIHSAIDLLLKDAAAKSTVDELLSGKPSYSLVDVTSTVNPVPAQSTLTVEQILNQKPVTVKDPLLDAVVNEKIVSPLADLLAAHKAGSLNAVNLQESKTSFAIDQILNSKVGSIIDDALALKNLDVASVLSKDDDANARVATILNGNKTGSVIDIVMPDQPMNLSSNSLEPLNINKLIGTGSLNNIKITQALDSLLSQKNKSAPNDEKNSKSSSHKSSGDDVDIVILNPKSKFAPESKTQKNDQAPAVKVEEKPAIDAILNAKIINPVVDLLTQAATKVDTASLIVPSTISSSFEKNEVKEPKGKPLAPFKSLPGPLKNQFKGYSTTSEVNETEFNTLSKKHLKEEKKEKFGLSLPMLSLVAKYKALADKKKK